MVANKNIFDQISDEDWESAKSFVLADGDYPAVIKSAGVTEGTGKGAGKHFLVWEVYIPAINGNKNISIPIMGSTAFLIKDNMAALGFSGYAKEDILDLAESTVGWNVTIRAFTKEGSQYQNLKFLSVQDRTALQF